MHSKFFWCFCITKTFVSSKKQSFVLFELEIVNIKYFLRFTVILYNYGMPDSPTDREFSIACSNAIFSAKLCFLKIVIIIIIYTKYDSKNGKNSFVNKSKSCHN